ncbi:MAG: hypothetical protein K2Q28_05405 [Hyphomicrobium sp.]|nr:hypothetical protein [Hyphomicrobium sp.]
MAVVPAGHAGLALSETVRSDLRSDIGIAVIGATTVTGDGATIIAACGDTATVDMGNYGFVPQICGWPAVIITIITSVIIEPKGQRREPLSTSLRALKVVYMPLQLLPGQKNLSKGGNSKARKLGHRAMSYVRRCPAVQRLARGWDQPTS